MPDTVIYLLMVATLAGILLLLAGSTLALVAAGRFLQGALAYWRSERRTARRREQLVQLIADPEGEFVACHSLVCGHMHTVHHRDEAGVLRCEYCRTPAQL